MSRLPIDSKTLWGSLALAAVTAGCAGPSRSQPREAVAQAAQPSPAPELPEPAAKAVVSGDWLTATGLEDCSVDPNRNGELVAFCPDVLFGRKELPRQSPDAVINAWIDEARTALGQPLEILERAQAKMFGPSLTAVRLSIRRADAPPDSYNLVFLGVYDAGSATRRVWCSVSVDAPAGIARCHDRLLRFAEAPSP